VDKQKNKFTPEDIEKLDMVTKRIINKLLHLPTVELKRISEYGVGSQDAAAKVNAVRSLFGLDDGQLKS
jgi:glutamyl-tRNA reductase